MTPGLDDRGDVQGFGKSIAKPEVKFASSNNYKKLTSHEANTHLHNLGLMVKKLSRFLYEKAEDDHLRNNSLIQNYLLRLGSTLETVVLKNKSQNGIEKKDIVIDPTDSGFPLFVRDVAFLRKDQEKADKKLEELTSHTSLVESALRSSFYNVFPEKEIQEMNERKYFEVVKELDIPEPVEAYKPVFVGESEGSNHYIKTIERLETHHNIPRFYVVDFKVPAKSEIEGRISEEIESIVDKELFTSLVAYEMKHMAKSLESINGVQVQLIERFDVGPYHSKFTENSKEMNFLLENSDEGVMEFTTSMIFRDREVEKSTYKERWNGRRSGDLYTGQFSQVLQKKYMIMPFRVLQMAKQNKIAFPNHRVVSITNTGEMYL